MARASIVVTKKLKLSSIQDSFDLSEEDYERQVKKLQNRLQLIQQAYLGRRDRGVIVLEGWDAAGKGGTIRRLAWALDPRGFHVWPIAAPTDEDARHHYLYRFWRRLPEHGMVAVFDRSWYGRVAVERVEGFASKAEWTRAYREINEFEAMLAADGVRIVKIFMHISKEEQKGRFADRLITPEKQWKLTWQDFRNHGQWDAYVQAYEEMFARTSTPAARWHIVPANSKRHGRLAALSIIADRLADGMDLTPRGVDAETLKAARKVLGKTAGTG